MRSTSLLLALLTINIASAVVLLGWPNQPLPPPNARSAIGPGNDVTGSIGPTAPDMAGRAPELRRFFRVVVRESGRLQADDTTIRLAGISGPERDRVCRHASGEPWPCGVRAAAALSSLIRTRAVDCEVRDRVGSEVLSSCRVGNTDLSAWLLRNGWAEASDGADPAYVRASSNARRDRLGLWMREPR